ncbi:MAG: hypothetical protein A4E65_03294 [Syntrophorhabdus sp. PtaU1.Bin153]|nr:MAG: hypothetical protein A4E65_03294 [Syntrophorhabdus sp. PtaU1.Bin153]
MPLDGIMIKGLCSIADPSGRVVHTVRQNFSNPFTTDQSIEQP